MKKTLLLIAIAALFAVSGCKKVGEEITPLEEMMERQDPSLGGVTSYSSRQTAYVFSTGSSDFATLICNGYNNRASSIDDEQVKVVILSSPDVSHLTRTQWENILKVYTRGGSVIYLNPTLQQYANFCLQAYSILSKSGLGAEETYDELTSFYYFRNMLSQNPDWANKQFEAITICSDDVYLVHKLGDNMSGTQRVECYDGNTRELESSDSSACSVSEMSQYYKSMVANNLLEWIDAKIVNQNNSASKGAIDATDMGKEIVVQTPITFQPSTFTGLDWKFSITVPCRLTHTIWSFHEVDNHQDHYLVQRDICFEGRGLSCGPIDKTKWWGCKDAHNGYYGPYLRSIKVSSQMSDAAALVSDFAPQNPMESACYSDGFDWVKSGMLSMCEKPSLLIGGNYSVSSVKTNDASDMELKVCYDNNTPVYEYVANVVPQGHYSGLGEHDLAKENLCQDIDLGQSWIWTISPSENATYMFSTDFEVSVEFLASDFSFLKLKDYYMQNTVSYHDMRIALPVPPRAVQEWRMHCSGVSTELETFLRNNYSGYFYNQYFKMPAQSSVDCQSIDAFISDFEARLTNDKELWIDAGFSGTFEFVWQRGNSPEIYHTTTFVVE